MPQWICMGLGRTRRVRTGFPGHGQCYSWVAVHSVFYGIIAPVSLPCLLTHLYVLFALIYSFLNSGTFSSILPFLGNTTAHVAQEIWTKLCPFGSCCCGCQVTHVIWWDLFLPTNCPCRYVCLLLRKI